MRICAREWFREGYPMNLSKLPTRPGFERLPRRWVAERTFAWLSHNRRLGNDHEWLCATSEALIYAAMTRLMVKRLAHASDVFLVVSSKTSADGRCRGCAELCRMA